MYRYKQEFNLEHLIVESGAEKFEILELPLSRKVFLLLGLIALLVTGIVLIKVFYLSLLNGTFYKARASMNMEESITIPAVRGIIYDRHGEALVQNKPAYRVVLNAGLIKRNNVNLNLLFVSVGKILEIDEEILADRVQKANLEKSALITLARNITSRQVSRIRGLGNPALEVHDDYRRYYIKGPALAHVLGYTGLAKFKDMGGKSGLEKYYNDVLSGDDGVRLVYRDARLEILDEKLFIAPKNGENIHTTIDSGLQEYFYHSLQKALIRLGRTSGVGVAIDPRNGEVLALISLPSFDSNIFTEPERSEERTRLLSSPFNSLFNRAVSGTYAPGSTIKPLVAFAALSEGVIDTKKQIYSKGYIEIPNPYFPDRPSRFLDWKPHGWVNLYSALARSSNIYFYALGGGLSGQEFPDIKGLGIARLKEYWQKFGLGVKTGIDLEGEESGFLPDPETKEKLRDDIWRLGDTYNVAIGQGDLLVTPIQLISYISVVANGGTLYKPHIVKAVMNNEGVPLKERGPEPVMNFSRPNRYVKEVQKGMEDAVLKNYGTAHLLANLPVKSAAKTGSAQVANNTKTNAFFVGYAPSDNPEIVVLVLIENAREGSLNAVPVGKDVIGWYYRNRIQSLNLETE